MQKLFTEFKPASAAEWKNQLMKDLKGESYESLVWQNENGIEIKPFYTAEDLTQNYEPAFTHASWELCVDGGTRDAKALNTYLLERLNAGATSISVNCKGLDLETALKGIELNYIHSTFTVDSASAATLKNHFEKYYKADQLQCSLIPENFQTPPDLEDWKKVVSLFSAFAGIKTLGANALAFHNQDCLAYYELAILLSQLTEVMEFFKPVDPAKPLWIKTAVNADYFVQIAKLRALRRLWKLLSNEYGISAPLYVMVTTSLTNKSISDSYNNLLRTTVEAMAAVAGGCNELTVTNLDVLFPSGSGLAERMSLNQQLILKEESYLDKMADVSCGSYYIESLTDVLATKALETFKRFEKEGGYLKCVEKKIFSKEIAEQAEQKQARIYSQKQIVIGVNKYKNEKEKIAVSASQLQELQHQAFNNPVLNYELEHYFNLKNA